MGTLIDESDEIDLEAEWADQIVKKSMTPRRKQAAEHKRCMRKRIEELEEKRRLRNLLDDDFDMNLDAY